MLFDLWPSIAPGKPDVNAFVKKIYQGKALKYRPACRTRRGERERGLLQIEAGSGKERDILSQIIRDQNLPDGRRPAVFDPRGPGKKLRTL